MAGDGEKVQRAESREKRVRAERRKCNGLSSHVLVLENGLRKYFP